MPSRSNFRIVPYSMASQSSRVLAQRLDGLRVRPTSTTYTPRQRHVIINWGWGGNLEFDPHRVVNSPSAVNVAGNKLLSFRALSDAGVPVPPWTADKQEAWDNNWRTTVCRHELRAHSGRGIELVQRGSDLPDAPLYAKYIKKNREYRVHVTSTGMHCINQKKRRRDVPADQVNWQVRNHANGFTYVREDIQECPGIVQLARDSIDALGLDFGAVDIIHNDESGNSYVLEVNTAPGMEGSMIDYYEEVMRSFQ